MERIQSKASEKTGEQTSIQLRLWPEEMRAAPNSFLRSALFGIVKPGTRKALKQELLASWKGVDLRFTGWQLDQADLDVWMQAVHKARECLGAKVVLKERQFLRELGRSGGGKDIKWLRSSFDRLQACGVSLSLCDYEYQGSLIEKFARDKRTGRYVLIVNQDFSKLFEKGFTQLLLEERKNLKTSLAKWLQGYVRSHRATKTKPHRIALERLRVLCGSEVARVRDFRRSLTRAMNELQKLGVVASWRLISEGMVLQFSRTNSRK